MLESFLEFDPEQNDGTDQPNDNDDNDEDDDVSNVQ